jgi:hypothetical protein
MKVFGDRMFKFDLSCSEIPNSCGRIEKKFAVNNCTI